MVREHYVRNMRQAKTSIVRQLYSVKLLVSGLDIKKSQFAPKLTDTAFGKWFYSEAMLFASERSRHTLNDIEETLLAFHGRFSDIYAIYYGKHAGGLLGMLSVKRKPSPEQNASAQRLYEEMVPLSDRLKQQMSRLETILKQMPDETFSKLPKMPDKKLMTA